MRQFVKLDLFGQVFCFYFKNLDEAKIYYRIVPFVFVISHFTKKIHIINTTYQYVTYINVLLALFVSVFCLNIFCARHDKSGLIVKLGYFFMKILSKLLVGLYNLNTKRD